MREAAPRAAEARQWPFRRTPLKGGEWGPEALRGHPSHREGGPLFLKKKKALMEGLLTRQKFESCEQNILGMAGSEINKRFDNLSAFWHFLSPCAWHSHGARWQRCRQQAATAVACTARTVGKTPSKTGGLARRPTRCHLIPASLYALPHWKLVQQLRERWP